VHNKNLCQALEKNSFLSRTIWTKSHLGPIESTPGGQYLSPYALASDESVNESRKFVCLATVPMKKNMQTINPSIFTHINLYCYGQN
jgi:hypothetical protein